MLPNRATAGEQAIDSPYVRTLTGTILVNATPTMAGRIK
jgi:hypothetical protein